VKDGVKGLLDKHVAAKFVSVPMTFTKNELALKRSYDAWSEQIAEECAEDTFQRICTAQTIAWRPVAA
jgi:hypothetical protein